MSKRDAQFIDPRDTGLRALGLKQPVFDESTVARADKALELMSGSMQQWLDAEIQRLSEARRTAEVCLWSEAAMETLMAASHDLKGMGATYGYPLVTQIAASLCRLIETPAGKEVARRDPSLVCAHVDALRAAVRDHIKTDAHPLGRALVAALEARVAKLGVAPA